MTDHDRVVVCYISTWAVYRKGTASYGLDAFDPKLCTHAIYAFAGLDIENNAMKSLGKYGKRRGKLHSYIEGNLIRLIQRGFAKHVS